MVLVFDACQLVKREWVVQVLRRLRVIIQECFVEEGRDSSGFEEK